MVYHKLYGLLLETNQAIPGIPVLSGANPPDVLVHLRPRLSPLSAESLPEAIFHASATKDEDGTPVLRASWLAGGKHLALFYSDGTRFALDRQGNEVFADWPDSLTLEDAAPYLVGPVLGILLRLRGMVPLHASAVAIGKHALALVGPAGAGKSTTAAAFARLGYRVISDDVVVLQEEASGFVVPPGYPRVNLWTESVHALLGPDRTLPLISPAWDKHFMPLDPATQFEARSLPLGVIYLLQSRRRTLNAPAVTPVTPSQAFLRLLRNTYMNYLPDAEGRRQEFELLGRVLSQVPVRQFRATPDLSRLTDVCASIAADAKMLLRNRAPETEVAHPSSVSAEAIGASKGVN